MENRSNCVAKLALTRTIQISERNVKLGGNPACVEVGQQDVVVLRPNRNDELLYLAVASIVRKVTARVLKGWNIDSIRGGTQMLL